MASSGVIYADTTSEDAPKKRRVNKAALLHANDVIVRFAQRRIIDSDLFQPGKEETYENAVTISQGQETEIECLLREILNVPDNARESDRYKPIAKLLTLLSNGTLLFTPWDRVTEGGDAEDLRQDILAIKANRSEIETFHRNNQSKRSLSACFWDPETAKFKICYSDIQCVVKVNEEDAPHVPPDDDAVLLLRYLLLASKYQPHHACHIGLLVYKDGFFIVRLYPDAAIHSKLHLWEDKERTWSILRNLMEEIYHRPFTTEMFELMTMQPPPLHLPGNPYSRFQYRAPDGQQVYQLYDLYRGQGWRRNSYVALGIGPPLIRNPTLKSWRIFKTGWDDVTRSSNELEVYLQIFGEDGMASEKKRCTAGILRLDHELSRVVGAEAVTEREEGDVTRRNIVLAFKTIGNTLADCRSIMQFLKAMYDLAEISRMLVEEHGVLHRDISWANVLIDIRHAEGEKRDDLCGRPFIDVALGVPESEQKVHAALADLECARILDKPFDESEITGTPTFIASALCDVELDSMAPLNRNFCWAFNHIYGEPWQNAFEHSPERTHEVAEFFKAVANEQSNRPERDLPTRLLHAPIHDAESIVWIMVFFCLRAHTKGYDPKTDKTERERRKQRSYRFSLLVNNSLGQKSIREIPRKRDLLPSLHRFHKMLQNLGHYFDQPWYLLDGWSTDHRFHGHNALQHALLQEILKLEQEGDIMLESGPLPVDSGVAMPDDKAYTTILTGKRPLDDSASDGGPRKRRKIEGGLPEEPDNLIQSPPSGGAAEGRPGDVVSSASGDHEKKLENDVQPSPLCGFSDGAQSDEILSLSPGEQVQTWLSALGSAGRSMLWWTGTKDKRIIPACSNSPCI